MVHGLGVIPDCELSFGPHVNQVVSRGFYQLRSIKSCVKSLLTKAAKS